MSEKPTGKFLAWDTSSVTGVVTAFELKPELKIVAEWSLSLETSRHSERLLWTVDVLLQSAGWTLPELNGIVVGIGPGSFTGLRIGVTTAKILADQLEVPVYPVSSLKLLAQGFFERLDPKSRANTVIVACTDATKGEWFTAIGTSTRLKEATLTPEQAISEAKKALKKYPKAKWIAVGQSVERYAESFEELPARRRWSSDDDSIHRVQPRTLARMGASAVALNASVSTIELKPHYLRASEAEVKLEKGVLAPQKTVL